jgi:hypothetical protein
MPIRDAVLLAQDLDGDGSDEYVLLLRLHNSGVLRALMFYRDAESWRTGFARVQGARVHGEGSEDLLASLLERPIELREKRFRDIEIGDLRISVSGPHRE